MSCLSRIALTALLLLTATARVASAQDGEPSREPVLRIETGMHTSTISRIGVDRAGKFLVTASDDKTARVWEVQTGKLLRVLRVPIGVGVEGNLYAAAISPDGNTVAAGGRTSNEAGKVESVYLFDRESGRLKRRLTGLPLVVKHLAFSPDGTLLIAAFGGTKGVRVWRTSDCHLLNARPLHHEARTRDDGQPSDADGHQAAHRPGLPRRHVALSHSSNYNSAHWNATNSWERVHPCPHERVSAKTDRRYGSTLS